MIQRDIPAYQVLAGIRKSNIRQLAKERLSEMGGKYRACGGIEHLSLQQIR